MQPQPPTDNDYVDYDSADSAESEVEEDEEDVFDESTVGNERDDRDNTEHSNPNSFSWCVLRLAITTLVQHQLKDFLNVAGIELQGTPKKSIEATCIFMKETAITFSLIFTGLKK